VANVREPRAISHSDRKSDQVDAEKLARFARLDPKILRPIAHRTLQQQALTLICARDLMVPLSHPVLSMYRPHYLRGVLDEKCHDRIRVLRVVRSKEFRPHLHPRFWVRRWLNSPAVVPTCLG
jgi:hypothetical protein